MSPMETLHRSMLDGVCCSLFNRITVNMILFTENEHSKNKMCYGITELTNIKRSIIE